MKVTEKCDVYSFGVVALQILVGKYPHEVLLCLESRELDQHFIDFLDKRPTPPEGPAIQLLVMVATLILKCVAKDPLSRPTMRQVSQELLSSDFWSLSVPFNMITLQNLLDNFACR